MREVILKKKSEDYTISASACYKNEVLIHVYYSCISTGTETARIISSGIFYTK